MYTYNSQGQKVPVKRSENMSGAMVQNDPQKKKSAIPWWAVILILFFVLIVVSFLLRKRKGMKGSSQSGFRFRFF